MTEAVGDAEVTRMLDRFAGLVRQLTAVCNGEVVKQIGDEFMLVFADPNAAVEFGTRVRGDAEHAGLPPLRIGAHSGPVLYREGDYYGTTVNVAARVTSVAGGGQFVVTDAIHRHATGPDASFEPIGAHTVKGITEPVELFQVLTSAAG
jgi:adenylate cyclase